MNLRNLRFAYTQLLLVVYTDTEAGMNFEEVEEELADAWSDSMRRAKFLLQSYRDYTVHECDKLSWRVVIRNLSLDFVNRLSVNRSVIFCMKTEFVYAKKINESHSGLVI